MSAHLRCYHPTVAIFLYVLGIFCLVGLVLESDSREHVIGVNLPLTLHAVSIKVICVAMIILGVAPIDFWNISGMKPSNRNYGKS